MSCSNSPASPPTHPNARPPITCWIAATAGLTPTRALALAESMAADVTGRVSVRSAHHAWRGDLGCPFRRGRELAAES